MVAVTGQLVVHHYDQATVSPRIANHTNRAAQMLRLANRARVSRGIQRLQQSDKADKLAREHSKKMADAGYLFHTVSYPWGWWGEDVGFGGSPRSIFKAFMHSKEHKEILLDPKYNHSGVGFNVRQDVLWVTMVFFKKQ